MVMYGTSTWDTRMGLDPSAICSQRGHHWWSEGRWLTKCRLSRPVAHYNKPARGMACWPGIFKQLPSPSWGWCRSPSIASIGNRASEEPSRHDRHCIYRVISYSSSISTLPQSWQAKAACKRRNYVHERRAVSCMRFLFYFNEARS